LHCLLDEHPEIGRGLDLAPRARGRWSGRRRRVGWSAVGGRTV